PALMVREAPARVATTSVSLTPQAAVRNTDASVGPVAVADIDGDGDLDVFLCGGVVPGRYPEPASSQLYLNDGGTLKLDATNSAGLKQAGLVSGAIFSDLTGDVFPELVLACEWGPLKVFRNERGRFSSWDLPLSTNRTSPI